MDSSKITSFGDNWYLHKIKKKVFSKHNKIGKKRIFKIDKKNRSKNDINIKLDKFLKKFWYENAAKMSIKNYIAKYYLKVKCKSKKTL